MSVSQADPGLLLVRLHRSLNSAFEKGNATYLLWKGRQHVTLSRRAVGLRPPRHFAYRAQLSHSPFMLGLLPLGMFSLSVESQYHHDISACGP